MRVINDITSILGITGGAGGFSPSDIPGLQLWLEASPTTTGAVEGGTIQTWSDLSINSFDAAQATEAARPTLQLVNGVWVVRFDGTDDTLRNSDITVDQPHTMVIVAAYRKLGTSWMIDNISGNHSIVKGGTDTVTYFAGTAVDTSPNVPTIGEFFVDASVWNGASSEVWWDGVSVLVANIGAGAINGFELATNASSFGQVDIHALLVYDSALSEADRQALEAHYASRVTALNA